MRKGMVSRLASMAAVACALFACLCAPTPLFAATANQASVNGVEYPTVKEAIESAKPNDTVKLLGHATLTGGCSHPEVALLIDKSLTIDGAGYVLDCGSAFRRGVRIVGGKSAADTVDVTLRNVTVKNAYGTGGRCIETREGHFSLTLDHATLEETGAGNTQALTIGGDNNTFPNVVVKNGSVIKTGDAGYGIITFNPANLVIDNSSVSGYAALYFKTPDGSQGSTGIKVTVKNGSVLTGNNPHGAGQNDFGVIVAEDDGVSVDIVDSKVISSATGESQQRVISFDKRTTGTEPSLVTVSGASEIAVNGPLASFTNNTPSDGESVVVKGGVSNSDNIVPYIEEGKVALNDAGKYAVATPEEAEAAAVAFVEVDGRKIYFTDKAKADEYAQEQGSKPGSQVVVKPVTHVVTFVDPQFKNEVAAQTVKAGELAVKPADLAHEGYVFKGWFAGDKAYDFSLPVMGDIELTAMWEKAPAPETGNGDNGATGGSESTDKPADKVEGALPQTADASMLPVVSAALSGIGASAAAFVVSRKKR